MLNSTEYSKKRILSEIELNQLRLNAVNSRDSLLFGILYETGCLVSEIVDLRKKDILVEQRAIMFGDRLSRISAPLLESIQKFAFSKKSEDHIFSTRQSPKMTKKRVRQIVQRSSKEILGSPVNPHSIRYSHIAHAMSRGVSMDRIRHQVGLQRLRAKQLSELLKDEASE